MHSRDDRKSAVGKGRVRIAVGDLFEKTNATRWLWQVQELVTPAGHRPHARLVRYDYPSESRLFALSALADTRLFLPAVRQGGDRSNAPREPARLRTFSNAEWQNTRRSA
jgi:hypothetical protein